MLESLQGAGLVCRHLAGFNSVRQFSQGGLLSVRHSPPQHGLNVMLEQNYRRRRSFWEVQRHGKEIANSNVRAALAQPAGHSAANCMVRKLLYRIRSRISPPESVVDR